MKTRGAEGIGERRHVHDQITDRMIKALETGTVPWQKPWGAMGGWPRSMGTGNRYQGVNVLVLGMTAAERGYNSNWWGTYKQIQKLGGQVMKGQNEREGKGGTTVLWAETRQHETDELDPKTGEPKLEQYTVSSSAKVFNAAQCEGLPERFYPQLGTTEILAEPQAVLDGYLQSGGPELEHVPGDRAYYRTDGSDRIVMPLRTQFKTPSLYYLTGFHESVHSTGAPKRLDRPGIADFDHFGTGQYAEEELVAQMGAAFLLEETGILDDRLFDNSAAYVESWLGKLANDRTLVVKAASAASKAADLITEPTRQAQIAADKDAVKATQFELEAGW